MFHNGLRKKGFHSPPHEENTGLSSFINGDFETGDMTGWTTVYEVYTKYPLHQPIDAGIAFASNLLYLTDGLTQYNVQPHGNYGCRITMQEGDGLEDSIVSISQTIDLTNANTLDFLYVFLAGGEEEFYGYKWTVLIDETEIYSDSNFKTELTPKSLDVSAYDGEHSVTFLIYLEYMEHQGGMFFGLDDVELT